MTEVQDRSVDHDDEQVMPDEEIVMRACELLGVKFYSKELPDLSGKKPESEASRFMIAVLASRNDIARHTLRVLLAEIKKSPEYTSFEDKVDILVRMYRSFMKGEVEVVDEVVSIRTKITDDRKRRKYKPGGKRLLHIQLNTLATLASVVLMLIILVFLKKAYDKAEYFEDEVKAFRSRYAFVLEALDQDAVQEPAESTTADSPDSTETQTSTVRENPEAIHEEQFFNTILESLQLPSQQELFIIYLRNHNSGTQNTNETPLRGEVLSAIVEVDGNREVFVNALRLATGKEINEEKVNAFITMLGENIRLPAGSVLMDIYSDDASQDEKRCALIKAIFGMTENRKLIADYLEKLAQD